jgi:hypothetical protein
MDGPEYHENDRPREEARATCGAMPSEAPPPSPEARESLSPGRVPPKKPRYLLVALIVALVFGAGCWTEGCARLAFYRGESDPSLTLNGSIKSDVDRTRAEALYHRFTEVADAARKRAVPVAAATFVLGAALLALAARGLGGKASTRGPLIQVVIAQAAVVAVGYFLTRDMRAAELDWWLDATLTHQRESSTREQYESVAPTMKIVRLAEPTWVVIRTLASGLIVLALTRRRSRAFFEAASNTVEGS